MWRLLAIIQPVDGSTSAKTALIPGKPNRDGADRIDRERDRVFARLDRQRWHHRAGNDDFAAAQPLAASREHPSNQRHLHS